MEKEYLLIIDGSSLLSTQYYGNLPREIMFAKTEEAKSQFYNKILQTSDGIYTNAVYGFLKVFMKIIKKQKPTHIAVVWDAGRNTFRREMYREYKAQRGSTPVPLKAQYKLCQEILSKMNIAQFVDRKYEADDFAGSLCEKFKNKIQIKLMTKDHDYIQLIEENVQLWLMQNSVEKVYCLFDEYELDLSSYNIPDKVFEFNEELIKKEFGIEPKSLIDLKGLQGDSSDNIPGVKGCGSASAIPLISEYKTIERLYEEIKNMGKKKEAEIKAMWKEKLDIKRPPLAALLKESNDELVGEKAAVLSKKLATIKRDILIEVTLNELKLDINKEGLQEILSQLEIKSINID